MEIQLKFGESVVSQNSFLPPDKIINGNSPWYILQDARPRTTLVEYVNGEIVTINADSYIINKKEYDLTNSFGIEAIVVDKNVFILCRLAKGKEKSVFKTKKITRFETVTEGPENYLWPNIIES